MKFFEWMTPFEGEPDAAAGGGGSDISLPADLSNLSADDLMAKIEGTLAHVGDESEPEPIVEQGKEPVEAAPEEKIDEKPIEKPPESLIDIKPDKEDEKLLYFSKPKAAAMLRSHQTWMALQQIHPAITPESFQTTVESAGQYELLSASLQAGDPEGIGNTIGFLAQSPQGFQAIADIITEPTFSQVSPEIAAMVQSKIASRAIGDLQEMIGKAKNENEVAVLEYAAKRLAELHGQNYQPRPNGAQAQEDPAYTQMRTELEQLRGQRAQTIQAQWEGWKKDTWRTAMASVHEKITTYVDKYLSDKVPPFLKDSTVEALRKEVEKAYNASGPLRNDEAVLVKRAQANANSREQSRGKIASIHAQLAERVLETQGPKIVELAGQNFVEKVKAQTAKADANSQRKPIGAPGARSPQSIVPPVNFSGKTESQVEDILSQVAASVGA